MWKLHRGKCATRSRKSHTEDGKFIRIVRDRLKFTLYARLYLIGMNSRGVYIRIRTRAEDDLRTPSLSLYVFDVKIIHNFR